ncbi:hypothetical protein AcV7_005080 [Taiwanofungus camphoratus]|nr:hypothetical protein AcV7_005080 [Antrodia cinnamomea]
MLFSLFFFLLPASLHHPMSVTSLDDAFMSTSSPPSSLSSSLTWSYAIDSSPPSSPRIVPVVTPPESPGLSHPFAASTKANKPPHLYEKHDSASACASSYVYDGVSYVAHDHLYAVELNDPQTERVHVRTRSGEYPHVGITHPYAAYAKARQREDKVSYMDSHPSLQPCPFSHEEMYEPDLEDMQRQAWDDAITTAIDTANGIIDLAIWGTSSSPLTSIPPSIADLADLVVLPSQYQQRLQEPPLPSPVPRTLTRAHTIQTSSDSFWVSTQSPASAWGGKPLGKAASYSFVQAAAAPNRNEIQIYLANNKICMLPQELFQLSGLTVLSLRSNALRTLPPQIAKLSNLRELNIAYNKLRWLPAEMLDMHLEKLLVVGNPWIMPSVNFTASAQAKSGKHVSPTSVRFTIPSLTELCLRRLLAPFDSLANSQASSGERKSETVLEALYVLPLSGTDRYPPEILEILRACIPRAVAKPASFTSSYKIPRSYHEEDVHAHPRHSSSAPAQRPDAVGVDEETRLGIGICPSLAHHVSGDRKTPVFVQHAEERFTWERIVAGLNVGAGGGAGVPIRWRGCEKGCLEFLYNEDKEEPGKADDEDLQMELDDGDDEDGIQVVDLGNGGLSDLEDFE